MSTSTTSTDPQQNPEQRQQPAQDRAQGSAAQDSSQDAVEAARSGVEQAQGPEGGDELAQVRREAAQRRRQLREVEAERDQLQARVDAQDRATVEARAAERGFLDASDVWQAGVELGALRGEDGTLSDELIGAELAKLAEAKPHYLGRPGPNLHQGARAPAVESGPSFGEAFKRAVRGGR